MSALGYTGHGRKAAKADASEPKRNSMFKNRTFFGMSLIDLPLNAPPAGQDYGLWLLRIHDLGWHDGDRPRLRSGAPAAD